jgi:hypothetical protein
MTQPFKQYEKDVAQPEYSNRGAVGPGPSAAAVVLRVGADDLQDDCSSEIGWTLGEGWSHNDTDNRFEHDSADEEALSRELPALADEDPAVVRVYVYVVQGALVAEYAGDELGAIDTTGIHSFAIEYDDGGEGDPPEFTLTPDEFFSGYVHGLEVTAGVSYEGYRLVAAGDLADDAFVAEYDPNEEV